MLLVDDVEENLLELETLLAAPGRRLVSAASGEAAVEALRGSDFAVVILDVRLPRMSGFEVAERMRSDAATAHVPIVFVTAIEKDPRQVFAGYELGAVDYLLRPIDPHVLRTKVGVFCDLWTQRRIIERKNAELEARLAEIRTLRGLIPVCARCRKVRDDEGLWQRVELYLRERTFAEFTHAICEECARELYPELERGEEPGG